jgi:hypothetical protein
MRSNEERNPVPTRAEIEHTFLEAVQAFAVAMAAEDPTRGDYTIGVRISPDWPSGYDWIFNNPTSPTRGASDVGLLTPDEYAAIRASVWPPDGVPPWE